MNNSNIAHRFLTLAFMLVVIVSITAGCNHSNDAPSSAIPEQVSIEEATNVLNQAVAYASARDLEKLCGMGGSRLICQHHWEDAGGWESLPLESPEIVDTYLVPTKELGNGTLILGGRVLVLEGVDGQKRPYRTEFLVFRDSDSGKLVPLYPIYWSGIGIAQTDSQGRGITEPR